MQMTSRERLQAAIRSKPVDRLPWATLMDGYFTSSLPKQGLDLDLIGAAKYIGCDLMERHVAGPTSVFNGIIVRTENIPNGIRTCFETPVGTIFSENKFSGKTNYLSKHLIENIEDVKIFQYVAEHTDFEPQVKEFIAREKEIGDLGIATPSGCMSPVQETLQFLAGVENTVYLMADYPDEMDELFAAMYERNKKTVSYSAGVPHRCVF